MPETTIDDTRHDVLDRVARLHRHLNALGVATTSEVAAAVLVHAAMDLANGSCAHVVIADAAATSPCGTAGCTVCDRRPGGVPGGWVWRLREGTLAIGTDDTDDVTTRLVAWLVEQSALALDRVRRSESATATVDALLRQERERSDLVEVLAHDLRSPMTALYGFASLLADRWQDLDEDRRGDLLGMIQRETRRMDRLVQDVSSAVLGPTPALPLRPAAVDVGAVVTTLVAQGQTVSPHHPLRAEVAPDTPRVAADEDRVHQVLGNVLENVARHTPAGTRTVVSVRPEGDVVAVRISDDGPGVHPEDATRIFERGERSRTPAPGSGLGLHTARELAVAMGGDLTLELGAGATFVLRLPVADPA